MKLARRVPRKARIEIIPMIDTVFFLLVFFMMASLSMATYRGLPVNLPRAAAGTRAPADTATVTISRDGSTYVNREPVDTDALGASLRALAAAQPELAIVVNADAEVVHGRVVDVLDAVRAAGVGRLAIAVTPRQDGARR